MKEKTLGKYVLFVGVILILMRSKDIINHQLDVLDIIGVILGFVHIIFGIYILRKNNDN